jgi:hypothetical protein
MAVYTPVEVLLKDVPATIVPVSRIVRASHLSRFHFLTARVGSLVTCLTERDEVREAVGSTTLDRNDTMYFERPYLSYCSMTVLAAVRIAGSNGLLATVEPGEVTSHGSNCAPSTRPTSVLLGVGLRS